MPFELTLDGRREKMTVDEYLERTALLPRKMELLDGRLGGTEKELSALLQLALESLGIRHAVGLGDLDLWRRAVRERELREEGGSG